MMPISLSPEPLDFDKEVRKKGNAFLAKTPKPTNSEWSKHSHWQKYLPTLRVFYKGICNFCSTWIPHSTGVHSVDHFEHKNNSPQLAYEWKNYRYMSTRFNSRKGEKTIIDPYGLVPETFVINFKNFFIEVNKAITDTKTIALANHTIKELQFNSDNALVNERIKFFMDYHQKHISLDYLTRQAPFLAYEMKRQSKI